MADPETRHGVSELIRGTEGTGSTFARGLIVSGTGYLAGMAIGLLGLAIAARHVSQWAFGVYVLTEVFTSFLVCVTDLGIGVTVARVIARRSRSSPSLHRLLGTALCHRVVVAATASLGVLAVALAAEHAQLGPQVEGLGPPIAVLAFLVNLEFLLSGMVRGFRLYGTFSAAQVASTLTKTSLIALWVWRMDLGLIGLLWAAAVGAATAVLIEWFSLPHRPRLVFKRRDFKAMLSFGAPLGANGMLTFASQKTDSLILGAFGGAEVVALYGAGARLPDSLLRLSQPFEAVYLPTMAKLVAARRDFVATQLMNGCTRLVSVGMLTASVAAIAFGRELLETLFSAEYGKAAMVFSVLMLAVHMELVVYVLGNSLVAFGESDKPVKCNALATLVGLLGAAALIPLAGALGAAIARVVSRYTASVANVWFLRRRSVEVRVGAYLGPLALCAPFWLGAMSLRHLPVSTRLALVVGFVAASLAAGMVSVTDVRGVLSGLRRSGQGNVARAEGSP